MDARDSMRYDMAVRSPRAQAHLSGLGNDVPAAGWAVPLGGDVALYGREALAYGLVVVAATDLLVYFALRGHMAVALVARKPVQGVHWAPAHRGVLWGRAAGRQPLYAKLARALAAK